MAVIMSNPEQSKHLETARMKVGRLPADCNRGARLAQQIPSLRLLLWLAWEGARCRRSTCDMHACETPPTRLGCCSLKSICCRSAASGST